MQLVYLSSANGLMLVVAAFLYSLAGRDGTSKGIRRFGASFVIALLINITALLLSKWSWWLLAIYPLLIAQFVIGYSNNAGHGWIKRLLITSLSVASGAFLCWVFSGGWWLLIPHALIGVGTVMFSIKNPIPASVEEILVCLMNSTMLLFYPFAI